MEASGCVDKGAGKEKDDVDGKVTKDGAKGNSGQKSTTSKLKERWLMTRKTWRYMTDAGKKLFPDGVSPHRQADIPKVQEQFQRTCCKSKEFILWPHQGSSSQDVPYQCPYQQTAAADRSRPSTSGRRTSSGVTIPRERRRPANIRPPTADEIFGDDTSVSWSVPCSPTRTTFSHGSLPSPLTDRPSDHITWLIHPEMYTQLVRCYGSSTLQHVASRLLEEQLKEEDEFEYEEEEGTELLEIDGKRMRSIGAQTDSHLDMCVQTDQDDSAEDMVKVGAETRAETEAAFALSQSLKKESEEYDSKQSDPQQQQQQQQQRASEPASQRSKGKPLALLQQQHQQQVQQPFQKETPVLKKFWGRRESKGSELLQPSTPVTEKSLRGLASEKDREAPPPKGGVAAKLASLEAVKAPPKDGAKPKATQQPGPKSTTPQHTEKALEHKVEKKSIKNVFKLGLKCDTEPQDSVKKNLEKQCADRFKTVNYDKTLRNIKSKWTTEDEEQYQQQMRLLVEENLRADYPLPKDILKKKKKSRGIQVGDSLPQFILNAFRVSSPVEIFHAATRRRIRRPSKAESTDFSESEGSVSVASSMPTSPRYSITVADESGTRNLLLSEAEAIKLTQMGATLYNKRTSLDASYDSTDGDRQGPLMGGIPRDSPIGMSASGLPTYQRSMSAHQMSSGIPGLGPHLLYSGSGRRGSSRYSNPQSMTAAAVAAATRGHRASLLQTLLPAVMQRSRAGASAAHSSRLVAKRIWRTRSKSQSRASPATTSTWSPMGPTLWLSVTGLIVTLEGTSLLQLTELERLTLQRLALAKIAALNLGCPVNLPKDSTTVSSSKKRRPYLLKRKALTTGFFDSKKEEPRDAITCNSSGGQVFGLSLNRCLDNERIRLQQSAELTAAVSATAAATAAAGGDEPSLEGVGELSRKSSRACSRASFCSLADGAKQSSTGSLESLNLDRKRPSLISGDLLVGSAAAGATADLLQVEPPLSQVPSLVTTCCNHLLEHGLHTVGIFRVSSSKKRLRQLREEFDKGGEVQLTEAHCPHDVATLLKEFFREQPDPLLTRELYEPFLCTQKIRNRKLKLEATQHLLQLLPAANRDTLYALLAFLTTVAEHAADSISDTGETIPGNMMDSSNLATMFAPNILHNHRPGTDSAFPVAVASKQDDRTDCINVIRGMIDHNKELFEVPPELLDETYHHLMDTHPEALDVMLRRRTPPHDDRGHQLLQQLLGSLLQPGRLPPGSPPSSPPNTGLEVDLESGTSSVFEGSECSSSLPRSPTDHQEFDRLRGCDDGAEAGRSQRRDLAVQEPPACPATDDHATRMKLEDESKSSSGAEAPAGEDRGWFRRRDKSSSRELDRGAEEKSSERSRWFRKRDKTSSRGSIDYDIGAGGVRRKGSDKKKQEKVLRKEEKLLAKRRGSIDRGRESGSESADSRDLRQRSSSDQTVAQERLRVPDASLRRLSSPEIDACGVITASLKIPVSLQQQQQQHQHQHQHQQQQQHHHQQYQCPAAALVREPDIPFIEDAYLAEEARTRRREGSVTSRQRTGSSDSYLGQPITGTMSFQPLGRKDGEKQSHDSVLSSSSADMFTLSPSPRNTPSSDAMFASETSSPMSRTTSPPMVLSPDSGTPGLSPPPSPPPPIPRRMRRIEQLPSRTAPLAHSATHSLGKSPMVTAVSTCGTRERTAGSHLTNLIPITRSRTAEVPGSRDHKESSAAATTSVVGRSSGSSRCPGPEPSVSSSSSLKRYSRRRPSRQRDGPPDPQQQSQPTEGRAGSAQLWKRREIIASDPAEPETFV